MCIEKETEREILYYIERKSEKNEKQQKCLSYAHSRVHPIYKLISDNLIVNLIFDVII